MQWNRCGSCKTIGFEGKEKYAFNVSGVSQSEETRITWFGSGNRFYCHYLVISQSMSLGGAVKNIIWTE